MGQTTARGVRFLFGFSMYLFLAQCEQVYLILALALYESLILRKAKAYPGEEPYWPC